jgi:hypothetical protein
MCIFLVYSIISEKETIVHHMSTVIHNILHELTEVV